MDRCKYLGRKAETYARLCESLPFVCSQYSTENGLTLGWQATVILFTILHPLALLGSFIYSRFYHNRRIALPPDHENIHDEEFRDEEEVGPQAQRGPGEIDVDALWG